MTYDFRKWSAKAPVRRHRATAPMILMLLAVQCIASATFVFADSDRVDGGTLLPAIMAMAIAVSMSPFARDSWLGPGRRVFDEFEAQAIAQGTRIAYVVLLTLVLSLAAWMWLGARNGWTVPTTPGQWQGIGLTLLFIGTTLPIALTEWMVPMPTAAEEAEDDA